MRCFALLAAIALGQQPSIDEAMRMIAEGRLPEAEATLRRFASQWPRDADIRYRLGLVLVKQNRLDDAARELESAAALQPGFVFTWLALGDLRIRQNDQARALAAAAQAGKLAAKSAPAWKALAVLRARLGDLEGETVALRTLITLTPEDQSSYIRLATILLARRATEEARRIAESGAKRFPADAELLRLHGLALYGLGRKDESIDAFLAAMDAAPSSDLVHSSIETLLADAGSRMPAIVERLRRYRDSQPQSPLGPYLLAPAIPVEREALLRAALNLDRTFWPAWFELHHVLRGQDKPVEAIDALETTLRFNPNHEAAHFALAELYLEAGNREQARIHRAEHHRLRAAAVKNQ